MEKISIIISILLLILWRLAIPKENKKSINVFLKKNYLRIFPISFNIAISIEFEEWLNSWQYYKEILKQLNIMIKEEWLETYLKIKDCSEIIIFNNNKDAENFLNKNWLDLVIRWDFSTDNLKKDWKNINNLKFNLSYKTVNNNKKKQALRADIQSKFIEKRYWTIIEESSYNDINIVSNNINILCLYTLWVSLKVLGKISDSINIMEKLHRMLCNKGDDFSKHTKFHIIDSCWLILLNSIFDKKSYDLWIKYWEKIFNIDPNNHDALWNIAILYYKKWEIDKAKSFIDKLNSLYPNSQITKIDTAFLKIKEKSYSSAYKIYEEIRNFNRKNIMFNPQTAIEILRTEYTTNKEPAFLYASWILSYYFWDKIIAKKDFKTFLKETECIDWYSKMRKRTNKIFSKMH